MKTVCTLYGMNEEKNLPITFKNLLRQDFDYIFYIDDYSTDNSVKVAKEFNIETIRLRKKHESYVGKALLSKTVNHCIGAVYSIPDVNYFMVTGCDILLEKDYMKEIVKRMEQDKKLVVCSGVVMGEYNLASSPRGAGRVYRFNFWDYYIKRFPLSYSWESYPIYKALSLGFKTVSFRDLFMYASRPTRDYKTGYGFAMRELGYLMPYALGRCLLSFIKNQKNGVSMLKNYLFSDLPIIDKDVSVWLKTYQIKTMIGRVIK